MTPVLQLLLVVALLGIQLEATHSAPSDTSHVLQDELQAASQVTDILARRLALMPQVAAWKWQQQRPVQDRDRELVVLAAAARAAAKVGLEPDTVAPLFELQMAAARTVQEQLHQAWRAQPASVPAGPDLATELRPQLTRLGDQLLQELALALPALQDLTQPPAAMVTALATLGLPPPWPARLLSAAQQIRYASTPNTLMAVQARGVLRVGTTLDYAPFSSRTADGQPQGIDIDLASQLAASLNLPLRLVVTSWPTLTDDQRRGRFDIIMSGVTRTSLRARDGLFSNPYHRGGKAVIARCALVTELSDLEQLDQPQRTLVVNPGGTNQRWLQEHIHQAKVIVHPDNTSIFQALAEGLGDAMVTDAIEVALQANRHPQLCPALKGDLLTVAEKGYWLPFDPNWQAYVNLWLRELDNSGELKRVFQRHLADRPGAAP